MNLIEGVTISGFLTVVGFGVLVCALAAWEDWNRDRRELEAQRKSLRDAGFYGDIIEAGWVEETKEITPKQWAGICDREISGYPPCAEACGSCAEYECPACGSVYFEPGECALCPGWQVLRKK